MSDVEKSTDMALWVVGRINQLFESVPQDESPALLDGLPVLMGLESTWKHAILLLTIWEKEDMADYLSQKGFRISRVMELASVTRTALTEDAHVHDLSVEDLQKAFELLREHITLILNDKKIAEAVAEARHWYSQNSA